MDGRILWLDSVRITQADVCAFYAKSDGAMEKRCVQCGGRVLSWPGSSRGISHRRLWPMFGVRDDCLVPQTLCHSCAHAYWCPTLDALAPDAVGSYPHLTARTYHWFCLGLSLAQLLGLPNGEAFLRALEDLCAEAHTSFSASYLPSWVSPLHRSFSPSTPTASIRSLASV